MADLDIRIATPAEYPAVDRLVKDAYFHDYGVQDTSWDDYREAHKRVQYPLDIWVAVRRNDGEIVATISSRRLGERAVYDETPADEMDLRLLAVSPAARRQGLAARMMQYMQQHAAEVGFRRVVLKTEKVMRSACDFYRALGWEHDTARSYIWEDGVRNPQLDHVLCFTAPARFNGGEL